MKALVVAATLFAVGALPASAQNAIESSKLSAGAVVQGTAEQGAKLNAGAVVLGTAEQGSKLNAAAVLQGGAMDAPKIVAYAVLKNAPGGGAVSRAPLTHW